MTKSLSGGLTALFTPLAISCHSERKLKPLSFRTKAFVIPNEVRNLLFASPIDAAGQKPIPRRYRSSE